MPKLLVPKDLHVVLGHSPDDFIWVWVNQEVIALHNESARNASHYDWGYRQLISACLGVEPVDFDSGEHWRGRYDVGRNTVTVIPPSKRWGDLRPPPPVLLRELQRKFVPDRILHFRTNYEYEEVKCWLV